jgi:exosortase
VSADSLRRFPGLVLALHALCFWPVWRWYAARTTDGSDEPWGIAALAAALLLTWPKRGSWTLRTDDRLLGAAALLTFAYAVAVPFAPPLVRAALAMAALACSWVSVANLRDKLAPVIVLFALSLPVIASLQFYCGYPLRSITTAGAALTLDLLGFDVEHTGTALLWQGHTVLVDAPCSGVRMLWTSAALACVVALLRASIGWRRLTILLLLSAAAALVANVLRAAALFVLETRSSPAPELMHTWVGIATFTVTAVSIVLIDSVRGPQCVKRGEQRSCTH